MTDAQPTELPAPSAADAARPVGNAPPVVFVGGTGRSGTHVLARLLARHPRLAHGPGRGPLPRRGAGLSRAARRAASRSETSCGACAGFWWKGFQTRRMRGMYRFVPRERFDARASTPSRRPSTTTPRRACRQLFYDLLWFRAGEADPRRRTARTGRAEHRHGRRRPPTLARLFPEAKFIHVVRDGRDASASRVAQTRGLVHPRTRRQGLEWWEERIRRDRRRAPTRSRPTAC